MLLSQYAMTTTKLQFATFLIILLSVLYINNAKIHKNATFVATEYWQDIPEGMAIPAGLHVRINFQTHKREAKLLDKSENDSKNNAITLKENAEYEETGESKKKILLSDALKNLPKDERKIKYTPENLSQIKNDFKAAKKSLTEKFDDKMRRTFHSDEEIIIMLIEEFLNLTNSNEHKNVHHMDEVSKRKSQILDSFDHMLHQIDNSILFVSQRGLDILLPIVVNGTHSLRVKATRLLGVLTQNNPKVQAEVFKQNFHNYLLKTLISSTNTDELSTALYAFGSLLRKNPLVQKELLSKSGTQALVAVINRECELKIKIKAIIIISDIIEEYYHMSELVSSNIVNEEIVEKYKALKLYEWLKVNEFCEAVQSTVINEALQLLEQPDLVENILEAMRNANPICKIPWSQNSQMPNVLLAIKSHYASSSDDYRIEIGQQIEEILIMLQTNQRQEL